jgi:glycosyltransferase involved in cell wall biosynthesis
MDTELPIQFTGIVVTYNEERQLQECLESLDFCQELIVIDLRSVDRSVEIAQEYGAKVIQHDRVPVVEMIRKKAVSYARNDWIVFLDPDEVLPDDIEDKLRLLIEQDPRIGVIRIPWQFYFMGKPLYVTRWGTQKVKGVVRHRRRNEFNPKVHRGMRLLNGFTGATVSRNSRFFIKHYWVESYREMFEKHWRYIKEEGKARYESGERFKLYNWLRTTLAVLKQDLIDYKGLKGGFKGVFLSFFYAWYVNMSFLSLWRYQSRLRARQ